MLPEILAEFSWSFAGSIPNVPLSSDLEVKEWRRVDGDEGGDPKNKPLFVTLPLLKVGTRSKNGLNWDKPSAMRIVQEINNRRPDGNLGHLPVEKRSTDYKLPVLRWLGAMLDEDTGLVWGKAYVPEYAQDVREFLTDAKRARARVGTSVYGVQGDKGLADMSLESIDLGHPDRVSHPNAAAVPHITSELKHESTDNKDGEKNPMGSNESDLKIVSELTTQKDNALRQVSELVTEKGKLETVVSEMKGKVDTLVSVEKLVAEFDGSNVTEKIGKLVAELRAAQTKLRQGEVDGWIAEAVKVVELEDLRPTIVAQMGAVDSLDKAKTRVTELMAREDIKLIAEALRDKATGGNAFVGGKGQGDKNPYAGIDKPESISAARAHLGL